jgi:hypothetical protein
VGKVRNKLFLLSVLVILVFCSASALAESEIVVSNTDNNIAIGEFAEFSLKITNNEAVTQRYSIYSLQSGQGWNVDPSPLKDKIIELGPGKTYTTKIIAQPLETFSPGIYNVHITIESDKGERYNQALKIYLSPENPGSYLPSISATIDMDEKINPQETISIKLFMDNKNPKDLSGLTVKIQSDMAEFSKEITTDLAPLDKKTVEFTITPNPFQQPKDYTLFFVFEHEGEVAKIMEQKIEILSLVPGFDSDTVEDNVFLKIFKEVTVTNEGNTINTQEVKLPISFWASLFVSSEEGTVKKIDGTRYLTWETSMSPGETQTLNYVINYRILLYLLVILVLFGSFYWYVQTPITISKNAQTTKSDEEGALSEIKIVLDVKNKSKRPLKNVTIRDLVPGIANVEKSLELGTLRPKEVKHTKQGTKVVWNLAELDVHEHRVITYKVKAKLNIVGTFSLPRAIVEYAKKGKKQGKAYSNIFRLEG